MERITALLGEAQDGRPEALQEVVSLVYPELLRRAQAQVRTYYRGGAPSPTLEPAALVSEAYLRLIKQRARFDNRGHFFAIVSQLMLRVLLDHERAQGRRKRGGDYVRVSLSEAGELPVGQNCSVEAFAEALERLVTLNGRAADIVKARLLWGLTVPEIAEAFEMSSRTVERDLAFAQRWLTLELRSDWSGRP